MRVPSTVSTNCLKAYEPDQLWARKWKNRKIRSYSIGSWDCQIPKSLQEVCLECIAFNWTEYPILDEIIPLENRVLLLDLLPTDLPLELTIPKIHDEIFWKKCFAERWPRRVPNIKCHAPPSIIKKTEIQMEEGRTFKKLYCERHVKEYLESLKPEDYNPEKIKELCDLCGDYVEILRIEQMISSEISCNKIPLNSVITGFPHLVELSLKFKQIYALQEFSWDIVNTSEEDVGLLAKGLERIRLKILRITNSDIDCRKIIVILRAILKHELEILDFSHCKIGDKGMLALSKFLLENPVKELFLANNRIRSKEICSLAYAVAQTTCNVAILDISLNQFSDSSGNLLVNSLVKYNSTVKTLSICGCGLTEKFLVAKALRNNTCLQNLNISNNALGEGTGLELLEVFKHNATVKKLDMRMCKVPSEVEVEIQHEIYRNRKGLKRTSLGFKDDLVAQWDKDVLVEMEEINLL